LKAKLYNLQILFLSLLGFYPLLKFDWSSKILTVFCLISIISAILNKNINFTRKSFFSFLLMTGYFLILIISIIYASNKEASIKRIIQFTPLLIIPFLLSFTDFKIPRKKVSSIFMLFIGVNMLYTVFITYLFLSNPDRFEFNLWHYLLDYDKFQFIINKNLHYNFFLVHKPYFSMGFVLCAIFSLDIFFKSNSKKYFIQILYLLVFIYFSFWVFYAFSFPNVIALLLSVVFIFYLNLKKKIFLSASVLFLVSFAIFLTIKSKDVDVQRGFNFVKTFTNDKKYEVNDTRQEVYSSIVNIIRKSDLSEVLFGFGVGDVQDQLNAEYKNRLSLNKSKNLLYFSEEFNHKYWHKNNIHIIANEEISPTDKNNADLIVLDNLFEEVSHNICSEVIVKKEGIYTFSVFVKKSNSDKVILRLGEIDQRAVFDLKKGKLFQKLNVEKAEIKILSNNWYRCSITVTLKKNGLALIGLPNDKGDYVYTSTSNKSLCFWGAQLEKGELSSYIKNNNEQLQIALDENLNTHNNYLYFLLATGVVGLMSFLMFILYLFKISLKPINVLKVSFCIIIALNFLTENILSRHWGVMFFTFMLILLFSNREKTIQH
jgi:hypothetical protein